MGVSIDPHFYKTKTLVEAFKRDGVDDEPRLLEIMGKFGNFIGDYYFLMNNERASDGGNPYYDLADVLNAVFKHNGGLDNDDFFDTYLDCENERGITYALAADVAEELGIELPNSSEDDE